MKLREDDRKKTIAGKTEAPAKLQFVYFPRYAEFLRDHRLREFISEQFHLMLAMDFPMLRNTDILQFTEPEIIDMSLRAHTEFLTSAARNELGRYLNETLKKWRADQLPNVSREELVAEDITLSSFIRKKALLKFIPDYYTDLHEALALVAEIEEYTLEAETRSFNTFLDIHNAKIRKVHLKLGKRTDQLLEAQELANLGSFEWDLTGKKKSSFSPQMYSIFGLDDLSDTAKIIELVHPQDRNKVRQMVNAALKGRREFDLEFRYRHGDTEKVLWCRGLVESRDLTPFRIRGTVMDVTVRHRLIRELQKNDELYRQAERIAHLGNWSYDLRSMEIRWSDEMYRIFNLSPQSKEITLDYFLGLVHPHDQAWLKRRLRTILVDQQMDYRLRVLLPGDSVRHLLGRCEVLRNENRKAYKLIGTCQDITKEVQMTEQLKAREESLAQLNASLEQKNQELQRKNEELTSFNYIASHDLQEPLRKIKTFSDLLMTRERNGLSETGKSWVDRIGGAAGRMQKLIQDLLAFSRTQFFEDQREVVDLNAIFDNIAVLYENEIAAQKLVIDCQKLPRVKGIAFQLQQLFENLVSNSLKYHKEGVAATVNVRCEKAEVISSSLKPEKDFLKISVSDQGIGFEQKYASRIFEIFQRLHGQLSYSGTGIGLAICRKIVENHDGFIRASGEPGEGAVFDVYLPLSMVMEE